MTSRRSLALAGLVLPLVALTLAAGPLAAAPPRQTLVIVTQKNAALFDIALRDLKHLYTGEQVDGPAGMALIPLNHPPRAAARVAFDRLVLNMNADEIGRFWIDRKIRGQTGAPRAVPSIELLRRVVATLPGTLTYLDANDVTAELKVLRIDGRTPSDPGYPLHAE